MADQRFVSPRGSNDREDPYANDGGWRPGNTQSNDVSKNAGNTLGDIDDALRAQEEMSVGNSAAGLYRPEGSDSKQADSKDLQQMESGGSMAEIAAGVPGLSAREPSLFSGDENKLGLRKRFRIGKAISRRSGIGGAIGLLIGGGVFFGASIASGPLQLIHYGQLLAGITPFQHQTSESDGRVSKLLRWASSDDVGETRLSTLGSVTNKRIQADFAKQGIKITTDPRTGQMKSITLDTAAEGSKYADLDSDAARAQIAADNGLSVDKVRKISGLKGNGKYAFSTDGISTTNKRGILAGFVSDQKLGKVSSYTRFRTLTTYYNEQNWLHPIKKAAAAADRKSSAAIRAKALKADEDSRLKKLVAKSDAVKEFNASIREKISPNGFKAVAGGLIVSQAVCIGKDIVSAVPVINRANVVIPAMLSAGDGLALGSQTQTRQDSTLDQTGAATTSLTAPDGSTPWQSQGIQRIAHNTATATGVATTKGISQAFSGDSKAKSIDKALDASGAGLLCNPVSQALQGAAGLALLFTGAGGAIEKGAQLAFSYGVGLVIGALTQSLTQILADDPITGIPHQGAIGGNVDALGVLALADAHAVPKGGTQLTPTEVSQLDVSSGIDSDFRSQSFASRIFNVHDYRSVAGRVIDRQNPNLAYGVTNTTASALTSITHFGSAFSNLASALFPHAQAAATTPYGLGVPEFGKSVSMLNDNNFDNPYDNAEKAAKLFDNDTGNYIEKAKTCFGVTISKDGNGKWGAVGVADVNTATADYDEANCGDKDLDWRRVQMFVSDTADMEGYACYKLNDSQSCIDDGFNRAAATTPAGDANSVDQKAMYEDSSNIACAPGTTDAGIQDGYHGANNKVEIRVCAIPGIPSTSDESHGGYGSGYNGGNVLVNSRVSANYLALATAANKDNVNLSASSSFRTNAHQASLVAQCRAKSGCVVGTDVAAAGDSNHQMGLAIDFAVPENNTGACSAGRAEDKGNAIWDWLNNHAASYGIKQYGHEAWHWDTLADSTRCGGDGT